MECKKTNKGKVVAVLEIFHDSDLGPNNVDFEHTITLFKNKKSARSFINKRKRTVRMCPLAALNKITIDQDDLIVFASDDWYRWEVSNVEVPE